ncbi:hypothetical protein GCM10007094_22910 [Pseudovibrio japonicus]|uniref:Uncharacterized protein n=1 Tax=Pseudovibrio japonicus TaxID=366534 RepID=A0ABQ3ECM7_9HYPH|nr:hypothetical protein [Pseudovibrio japonicus]GHB33587.1 hypothetical protein GCM10007094_22910 [Pseudovibrio japonicus]
MPIDINRDDHSDKVKSRHAAARQDVFDSLLKAATAHLDDRNAEVDFLNMFNSDLVLCEPELGSIVKHRDTEEVGFVCGEVTMLSGLRALKFRPFDSSPTESVTCDPSELIVIGDPKLRVGYPVHCEN